MNLLIFLCLMLTPGASKVDSQIAQIKLQNPAGKSIVLDTYSNALILWTPKPERFIEENWSLLEMTTKALPIKLLNTGKHDFTHVLYPVYRSDELSWTKKHRTGFAFLENGEITQTGPNLPVFSTVQEKAFGDVDVDKYLAVETGFERIVRQRTNADCGYAASAMILQRLKNHDGVEDFLAPFDLTQPLSLLELKNILSNQGFEAEGFRGKVDNLGNKRAANILFFGGDHFVIFVAKLQRGVVLLDPRGGRTLMNLETFKDNWNGVYLHVKKIN